MLAVKIHFFFGNSWVVCWDWLIWLLCVSSGLYGSCVLVPSYVFSALRTPLLWLKMVGVVTPRKCADTRNRNPFLPFPSSTPTQWQPIPFPPLVLFSAVSSTWNDLPHFCVQLLSVPQLMYTPPLRCLSWPRSSRGAIHSLMITLLF